MELILRMQANHARSLKLVLMIDDESDSADTAGLVTRSADCAALLEKVARSLWGLVEIAPSERSTFEE